MWEEHRRRISEEAELAGDSFEAVGITSLERELQRDSDLGTDLGDGRAPSEPVRKSLLQQQRRERVHHKLFPTTIPQVVAVEGGVTAAQSRTLAPPSSANETGPASSGNAIRPRWDPAQRFEPYVLTSSPGLRRAFIPKLHVVTSWSPRLCNLLLPKYLLSFDGECTVKLYRCGESNWQSRESRKGTMPLNPSQCL